MRIYKEDVNPYSLVEVYKALRALKNGAILITDPGPRLQRQWADTSNTTHEPQSQTDTTRRPA